MNEVLGAETLDILIKDGVLFRGPSDGRIEMYEIEGIYLTKHAYPPSTIHAMKTWHARSDDVFIVSYPKAGTTWTQEVVSAICHNGDLRELDKCHTMFRVPYLERSAISYQKIYVPPTYELLGKMKSPRTIKSHLPGHLLPPDIMQKKAKIVYIARNPKDVAVSCFFFHILDPRLPDYKSWNDFFNDFYAGKTIFGPWWKHYLYYWNKRHESNVLFLRFEELKKNLKGTVQKTAHFLGYTLTEDAIDGIVSHCTFENMKKNPMSNLDTIYSGLKEVEEERKKEDFQVDSSKKNGQTRTPFMRKGKVGDWKNHFTVAQNQAMDELIREKLAGSGLQFIY